MLLVNVDPVLGRSRIARKTRKRKKRKRKKRKARTKRRRRQRRRRKIRKKKRTFVHFAHESHMNALPVGQNLNDHNLFLLCAVARVPLLCQARGRT